MSAPYSYQSQAQILRVCLPIEHKSSAQVPVRWRGWETYPTRTPAITVEQGLAFRISLFPPGSTPYPAPLRLALDWPYSGGEDVVLQWHEARRDPCSALRLTALRTAGLCLYSTNF
jgi:hypothetical protein